MKEYKKRDPKVRFLEKVVVAESGCHEFASNIQKDGYGKFLYKNRSQYAHRVGWMLFVGEIPSDKWVLHKCDNRKCVNIDHLYIGTPTDNVRDKVERCEWWGNMRNSREIVDEAIRLYRDTDMSQQKIADLLGIRQVQVSRYVRGAQRKNL